MKRIKAVLLFLFLCGVASCGKDTVTSAPIADSGLRMRISVEGQMLTAVIYDNPTARDFISRLPQTVDLEDYGGAEKIFYPSPALAEEGSLVGMTPVAGDIAVYAPWGNVAVYYRGGTSSGDLIPIGRIQSGVEAFQASGTLSGVRFELAGTDTDEPDVPAPNPGEGDDNNDHTMNRNMTIHIGSAAFAATLVDNAAAKAFVALLPMSVRMNEMNGNEKYCNLPQNLPTATFHPGTIRTGDLLLYGSSTVVLFYETFSSSYNYTRLGLVDNPAGLAAALGRGDVTVSFEINR